MTAFQDIALIGFGEVGRILSDDLLVGPQVNVRAWDTAFADPQSGPSVAVRSRCSSVNGTSLSAGVNAGDRRGGLQSDSAAEAASGADLVISAVTAGQALDAAVATSSGLREGAFFLDLNSCSPRQKCDAAMAVQAVGGRYVEGAVMSPFPPSRLASPILLGGPHAAEFLERGANLGFTGAAVYSDVIGQAAAAKLCRSVVVKGMEALLMESLLAARHYGVEETVLESLANLQTQSDWRSAAKYMISRSLEHGVRRAEEMRETAQMVRGAGVKPLMSEAIAQWQDTAGAYKQLLCDDLEPMLDAMLDALRKADQ